MPVPIAIIVCEGDTETISHIAKALKKNLPIIIMKGSGKAADLVLDYLETYTSINYFEIVNIRACVIFCKHFFPYVSFTLVEIIRSTIFRDRKYLILGVKEPHDIIIFLIH